MTRKFIVAGNWKMNNTFEEGIELAENINKDIPHGISLAVLGTPFIHLKAVSNIIKESTHLFLSAQNCHQEESGAYTGEVSIGMLQSVGVDYVILGHSERRAYFAESNELLSKKVDIVLKHNRSPIFCCGEGLDIRKEGGHIAYVCRQLEASLFHLSKTDFSKLVLAYEPIWAIGTGMTASPEQAEEMHAAIRDLVANQYGNDTAQQTTILYGGSCKPGNAAELFSNANVDGGLIGGASLNAKDFIALVEALNTAKS